MMRWLGTSGSRWSALGAALLALMLALPLALFALVSYHKLGFMSLSWYVPYEEFGQSLASGDVGRIYSAPLAAINTTSGFVIATMFTYTLGHTLVSTVLAALVLLHIRLLARRAVCQSRGLTASVGGAPAQAYELRVTTLFRREAGEWRIFHRHADPMPNTTAAGEQLKRL